VILITIVSNWSQLLTGKQTAKASSFATDAIAVQDATLMLKTELAASVNYTERIIVKNLTSNTTGILTGYKILVTENPNDYNFLNTQIDFDTEVTVLPGNINNFEVVCFPSRKFDLLLYTNHNTTEKIKVNVNTYDSLSCAQYYSYLNPPTINVTELTTSNTTPDLNGVISDTSATLSLILDGTTYIPTNDGDETWSLTGISELSSGSYDVNICATDTYGIVTCDESDTNELDIESIPIPTVTILSNSYSTHSCEYYIPQGNCEDFMIDIAISSNVESGTIYAELVNTSIATYSGNFATNFTYTPNICWGDGLENPDLNVCVTNESGTGCDQSTVGVCND